MDALDLKVIACPAPLRPAALRALHDGLPSDQRAALVDAIDRIGVADARGWDGLLVLARDAGCLAGEVTGAIWAQRAPGNTAVIWPPAADCPAADTLLRAAAQWCDAGSIPLAQLSLKDEEAHRGEQIELCGFSKLAELLYLFMEAGTADGQNALNADVQFAPRAGLSAGRLATLIEKTYVGTRDCPALDGLRAMTDVLAGYSAQGRHLPEHWYFVQLRRQDVGVLILADHPGSGNCELVYMGVVPEARGQGVGNLIVRRARASAALLGAQRLVLAVDATNGPALDLYHRAGFSEWDRRTIYARCVAKAT